MTGAIGLMGKRAPKSDTVHHKSETLAWLVYRRFPGINLNVAQPAASAENEERNGRTAAEAEVVTVFAIVCAYSLPTLSAVFRCIHRASVEKLAMRGKRKGYSRPRPRPAGYDRRDGKSSG